MVNITHQHADIDRTLRAIYCHGRYLV